MTVRFCFVFSDPIGMELLIGHHRRKLWEDDSDWRNHCHNDGLDWLKDMPEQDWQPPPWWSSGRQGS
jgi:hypothetical protein